MGPPEAFRKTPHVTIAGELWEKAKSGRAFGIESAYVRQIPSGLRNGAPAL